jgi:uncharacterized membrane protein YcaP (DUF421 family)
VAAPGDLGSGWGSTLTIAQDAARLRVEYPIFSQYDLQPPLAFTYPLDGSVGRNTVNMGRGDQLESSRVRWQGQTLIIVTTSQITDRAAGQPFTAELTRKLWLDSPTTLVIEATRTGVLGGPPPRPVRSIARDDASDNTTGGVMHLVDWQALIKDLFAWNASAQVLWYLDKMLRPVVVYLALVYSLKFMGRRTLAQLNPFDLVVLLMLSNTVQNAIIGEDNSLWGGIIGAAALLGVNWLLISHYYRGPSMASRIAEEEGDVYLIRNHELQEASLRRLRINVGELTARAHERGFDDLHEVETAVLYPNGTIYMKGESQDSARLAAILDQVTQLRHEIAELRAR